MEINIKRCGENVSARIDDAMVCSLQKNHGLSDMDIVISLCDTMLSQDGTQDYKQKQLLQEDSVE